MPLHASVAFGLIAALASLQSPLMVAVYWPDLTHRHWLSPLKPTPSLSASR
jgi:hypothetical protein